MKKIFLSFLIFLSLSYAKDLDILSIASNGSLSDKTSHKLNDDELKQVVGGLYVNHFEAFYNPSGNGTGVFKQYFTLSLSDDERRLGSICFDTRCSNYGYTSQAMYNEFVLHTRSGKDTAFLLATYDTSTNYIRYDFLVKHSPDDRFYFVATPPIQYIRDGIVITTNINDIVYQNAHLLQHIHNNGRLPWKEN